MIKVCLDRNLCKTCNGYCKKGEMTFIENDLETMRKIYLSRIEKQDLNYKESIAFANNATLNTLKDGYPYYLCNGFDGHG